MKKINNISKIEKTKLLKSMQKGLLALTLTLSLGACSSESNNNDEIKDVYIADEISLSNAVDIVGDYSNVDEILENENFCSKIGDLYNMEYYYAENRKKFELDKQYLYYCNNNTVDIALYLLKAKIIDTLGINPNDVESLVINANDTCSVSYSEDYNKVVSGNVFVTGTETIYKEYKLEGVSDIIDIITGIQTGIYKTKEQVDLNYKEVMKILCKVGNVEGKKIEFTYSKQLVDVVENSKVNSLTR